MTDVLTKRQRSYNMSRIRSKNTKPELFIFNELRKMNVSFETHYKLPGNPDVLILDKKLAIFIDGEFWHGRYLSKIRSRLSNYWISKITRNKMRDKKNRKLLRDEGWTVLRIWSDDLKMNPGKEIKKIKRGLNIL